MDHSSNEISPQRKNCIICLPMAHREKLAEHYALVYGVHITGLNTYINEGYLKAYFRDWGTVLSCKIKKYITDGKVDVQAYVRFSSRDEADKACWAGPHYFGGLEVKARPYVSLKTSDDVDTETEPVKPVGPRPMRPLGLGYLLEDPQWLEKSDSEEEK